MIWNLGREQIVIERDIQVGGVTLAAGRYALLPAAYALLPGSFLVQPGAAGSAAPARGAAVLQPNGALLIGARLATSGTDQIDARPGSFTITPSALARESSEIRVTASQPYFSAAAQRNGDTVPRLAADAGTLNLRTQQLVLQGQLGFASSGRSGSAPSRAGSSAGSVKQPRALAVASQIEPLALVILAHPHRDHQTDQHR